MRVSSKPKCDGSNSVTVLPDRDLDGKPRYIDGKGDLAVIVYMGAYEHGDICECGYLADLVTHGADLAKHIDNPEYQKLGLSASEHKPPPCFKEGVCVSTKSLCRHLSFGYV